MSAPKIIIERFTSDKSLPYVSREEGEYACEFFAKEWANLIGITYSPHVKCGDMLIDPGEFIFNILTTRDIQQHVGYNGVSTFKLRCISEFYLTSPHDRINYKNIKDILFWEYYSYAKTRLFNSCDNVIVTPQLVDDYVNVYFMPHIVVDIRRSRHWRSDVEIITHQYYPEFMAKPKISTYCADDYLSRLLPIS